MQEEKQAKLSDAFSRAGFKTGFLKLAILKLVAQRPVHGYAMMKEIEAITDGDWKPSPGSIYPALQELMDKGLIVRRNAGRRRVYEITPSGQETLEAASEHVHQVLRYLQHLFAEEPRSS